MVSHNTPKAGNPDLRVLVYEGAGSQPLDTQQRFDAIKTLLEGGYAVTRATGEGDVAAHDDRTLVVFGRFDSELPPQMSRAGLATDVELHVHQVEESHCADDLLHTAEQVRQAQPHPDQKNDNQPGQWKPWFPVIDFDRCTNCMQCLSFCLFDVYGVDENETIQVQNNTNCKTDCPACSRVCPEVAILFPKYRNGPINGDEINNDDVKREQMKVDISSLLGGDIYDALKNRSIKAKSRFAKERDEDKALKERLRCLKKLTEDELTDTAIEAYYELGRISMQTAGARFIALALDPPDDLFGKVVEARRSEERRVGKECRSRWSPYH